ncbi:MAG: hypothetical protein IPH99_05050 [Xanthomonadales bacterium]|nr:hypothetical protein [Xanthomonadales bacterium]
MVTPALREREQQSIVVTTSSPPGWQMAHVHAPGLVLRMDPDALIREGATCSCAEHEAVHAQHYFVCIEANARDGLWLPLFSAPRVGTKELPNAARIGDPRWVGTSSHYHPEQIWRAPHKAVQRAAAAAHDSSSGKLANRIKTEFLPPIAELMPFKEQDRRGD